MTGFAAATFLRGPAIDSQDAAMASFAAFFIPFGMPHLMIVDDDWPIQRCLPSNLLAVADANLSSVPREPQGMPE